VRPAHAHGDLHERIELISKLIAASPDDYTLYLKRGDLHRQHQEWSLAVADFEQAQRLAPRQVDVDYYLGLTWLEADDPARAIAFLSRYVAAHPDQAQALLARARTRVALGAYTAAAGDYSRVIDLAEQPTPDLYTAKAAALLAAGDSQLDAAMDAIRQGVRRIGPIVSLIEYAVTVETAHRRYDKALAWIGDLPENIASQPLWLARRADLESADGKKTAALANYRAAYAAVMQNLQRRNTRANLAFEADLRNKIAALEKQSGTSQ
jgi:tetratricopeptide (TPR) repeat protein